jgi:hypothetical protein
MATIAGTAALAAFLAAGLMLLLAGLGLWHGRRTPDSEAGFGGHPEPATAVVVNPPGTRRSASPAEPGVPRRPSYASDPVSPIPPHTASEGIADVSPPTAIGRRKGEARLDVHNSNVNEDIAETGLCGTLDLSTGHLPVARLAPSGL